MVVQEKKNQLKKNNKKLKIKKTDIVRIKSPFSYPARQLYLR